MDGITAAYGGVVGDAKLTLSSGSSIYVPESVSASFALIARQQMDLSLLRLAAARDAFGGAPAVEIVTKDVRAAMAWEARMTALDIAGYARLQP